MTATNDVLTDFARRLNDTLEVAVDGLSQADAERTPAPGANTICWLLWHSARCIDQQLHAIIGGPQLWDVWKPRLALPLTDDELGWGEIGYRQSPSDAARVIAPVDELVAYLREAIAELVAHCERVADADLTAVVDESWDPPVTHGVRLVSIIDDVAQHLGAAAYLRGLYA